MKLKAKTKVVLTPVAAQRAAELTALRKTLGLTQTEMAEGMGMTLRPYQMLEAGGTPVLKRHLHVAEWLALDLAVARGNPMLAPAPMRRKALELARLITGELAGEVSPDR